MSGGQRATVVKVVDGDTLRLVGSGPGPLAEGKEERVRLLEIDAPEVGERSDCFGPEATQRLAELAPPGASVRVVADRDPRDRYGRALVYVFTSDGLLVNELLVRSGHARVLLVAPNDRFASRLRAAQRAARQAGAGQWSACP